MNFRSIILTWQFGFELLRSEPPSPLTLVCFGMSCSARVIHVIGANQKPESTRRSPKNSKKLNVHLALQCNKNLESQSNFSSLTDIPSIFLSLFFGFMDFTYVSYLRCQAYLTYLIHRSHLSAYSNTSYSIVSCYSIGSDHSPDSIEFFSSGSSIHCPCT